MTELSEKRQILDAAGFVYEFYREVYVNRKAKKIISMDFIEEHSARQLGLALQRANDGTDWQFLFMDDPPPSVKHQLETALG